MEDLPPSAPPVSEPVGPQPRGLPLGVLLIAVALAGGLGFQTFSLARERQQLIALRQAQEPTLQQAYRTRTRVDALARGTLELAQTGHRGAAAIVELLGRRGITIDPDRPTAPPPGVR